MRSEVRLDSAVFQLTPTRTRCDLVVIANGKTEKIASGLLNPFVSHLKTAQDQIRKGGYSIKLEPDPYSDAAWFTKGTVERFVRFVSTPEVLERVNTIESEILQIEEAISSQENDNLGLSTLEEQPRSFGGSGGNMQMNGVDNEKAIVLFKTGSHSNPAVTNESKVHEENSKVQLVRVLESRKQVLQKEQAMAFARTAAAGFEMENIAHLMSFAESFGAFRLREACSRYMLLWEVKHDSGQWIEVEAAEALSYRSEFPPLNAAGIVFSEDVMKQKVFIDAWSASGRDVSMENNGNATSLDNDRDKKLFSEPQAPHKQPAYEGQIQHPPFSQWPSHSQPNPYFFQPYPMQAMPFYQNYPMDGQFLHSLYPPMEDPKLNIHQSKGKKQHSKYSKDGSSYSDDGTGQNTSEYEEEPSRVRRSDQKAGHSGKKKGVVVIQNLNYIPAKRNEVLGNKSESTSDSETDNIIEMFFDHGGREQKSSESLKRENNHQETTESSNAHGKNEELYIQEAEAGNWQAFQSFLLEAEEKVTSAIDGGIFAGEKEPPLKKAHNKDGPDPILLSTRDSGNYQEESIMEYDSFSNKGSRTKQAVSTDEFLVSTEGRVHLNSQADAQFKEIDVGVGGYRKVISDDFIMYGLEKQMPNKIFSDPLVDFEHEKGNKFDKSSPPNVIDESFVVPCRLGTQDQIGVGTRFAIDMDSEFRSAPQKEKDFLSKAISMVSYEPDDLTLILEHTRESELVGYNQTVDYDIQVPLIAMQVSKKEEDDVLASTNEAFIKSDEVKLKSLQSELEKKRKDTSMRKMTSLRPTTLIEAQKRAEKLRNYKSDLQKLKKEQEEEERRRLESLKRERQKRISSRNGPRAFQSSTNTQQSNLEKSSKVRDSEIGSNLPLQKLPISGSVGSIVSNKDIKTITSNKLNHGVLSLAELKESEKQEGYSVSARIRRLSEPKGSRVHGVPAKSASSSQVIKKALDEDPRSKMIQLDKKNSETMPELMIAADSSYSEVLQNKSSSMQQRVNGGGISMISESHCTETNPEKNPKLSHTDEYPLIEKTVVILENEVVPALHAQTSEGRIDAVVESPRGTKMESATIDVGYAAICASSPIGRVERENQTEENQNDPINSFEVNSQKLLEPAVTEKPYQAPFARASSLEEEAATDILQYAETPHDSNPETTMITTETIKASYLSSLPLPQTTETVEKPQNQKGLRKLWKFGRKGHNSQLMTSS
ncbi:COP1-interacting protein 7 isoform X4 [Dendrobium catenatum]|uniref:COP1-interacting protein 7 isoform X4 n=1 Tax=Dendrobium catenatum TaxID=906689 RepID=UPI0010A09DE0|nr:COP1-interacting protein 7 isoform X4 [Dendrobium catenatum]